MSFSFAVSSVTWPATWPEKYSTWNDILVVFAISFAIKIYVMIQYRLDELERDRVAKNCYLFFQKISLMEQKRGGM